VGRIRDLIYPGDTCSWPPDRAQPNQGDAHGVQRPLLAQRALAVHDGLAVASLVLSLVWLAGLGSLLAVIFGATSIRTANRENRERSGLAVAGLVIGIFGLVLAAVLIISLIIGAFGHNNTGCCFYQGG
jgi:Domain of unknown function (DUF4190)